MENKKSASCFARRVFFVCFVEAPRQKRCMFFLRPHCVFFLFGVWYIPMYLTPYVCISEKGSGVGSRKVGYRCGTRSRFGMQ